MINMYFIVAPFPPAARNESAFATETERYRGSRHAHRAPRSAHVTSRARPEHRPVEGGEGTLVRPSDRVGSPSDRVGSPSDRVGSPSDRVGSPSDRVGSPSDRVGSPSDRVGSPSDRVGSP